jgi:hypothetical protein
MPWITSTSFPPPRVIYLLFVCFSDIFSLLFLSSAIANQESLSGLETEMRKLEGIVKEIVDEMDYLKKREERFQTTNGKSPPFSCCVSH